MTVYPKLMMNAHQGPRTEQQFQDFFKDRSPDKYRLEPKLDGYRMMTLIQAGPIIGWSRLGADLLLEEKFPWIADSFRKSLPVNGSWNFIFDGELFATPEQGGFEYVTSVVKSKPDRARQLQEVHGSLSYVIFDILAYDSFYFGTPQGTGWITHWSYADRREFLEFLGIPISLTFTDLVDRNAPAVRIAPSKPVESSSLSLVAGLGLEGLMIKDVDAVYTPGKRSKAWIKVKPAWDADVVIMGFTDGRGKFKDQIGAVVFGQYVDNMLIQRGRCSGMPDDVRLAMTAHPEDWLYKVAVISHNGVHASLNGAYRHPQFQHLRDDKAPHECTWE